MSHCPGCDYVNNQIHNEGWDTYTPCPGIICPACAAKDAALLVADEMAEWIAGLDFVEDPEKGEELVQRYRARRAGQ